MPLLFVMGLQIVVRLSLFFSKYCPEEADLGTGSDGNIINRNTILCEMIGLADSCRLTLTKEHCVFPLVLVSVGD